MPGRSEGLSVNDDGQGTLTSVFQASKPDCFCRPRPIHRHVPFVACWQAVYRSRLSLAVGNGAAGSVPIFSDVYSLAQKSGGPSLSGTRLLTGLTPFFR